MKEVTGNIVIRNSYNGADLTGLDNIVSAGGLQVGSTDVASKSYGASHDFHESSGNALWRHIGI